MLSVAYQDLPGLAGKEIGVSDWITLDQDRVNLFADATEDHQWIHVDVERAKREMDTGGRGATDGDSRRTHCVKHKHIAARTPPGT